VKRAVSNIAWPAAQDDAVARILRSAGIGGIEIAPRKLFSDPAAATDEQVIAVRKLWEDRGLPIVAAQALLFGKPELTLFDSPETRQRTLDYLTRIVRLCAKLGAQALVFGSPKNRRRGSLPREHAEDIAVEFFAQLGRVAADEGTCVVLEANPPDYGADFITTAAEAITLVERVNHPGFRLHLDAGCMMLAGDPLTETFARGGSILRHVHISEPNLEPPGHSGRVDHAGFATQLRQMNYANWVSLEMREESPFDLDRFQRHVEWFAGS
jgi:sugar phosphate isomerase/epimerase